MLVDVAVWKLEHCEENGVLVHLRGATLTIDDEYNYLWSAGTPMTFSLGIVHYNFLKNAPSHNGLLCSVQGGPSLAK